MKIASRFDIAVNDLTMGHAGQLRDRYVAVTDGKAFVKIWDGRWQNLLDRDAPPEFFRAGPVTFGIAICHEGWRCPETVRRAVRRGAHIVFHPHFHQAEPGRYRPSGFADPLHSFHEKAALCRAAGNNYCFATVNFASIGSPTTSAVVQPDATLQIRMARWMEPADIGS